MHVLPHHQVKEPFFSSRMIIDLQAYHSKPLSCLHESKFSSFLCWLHASGISACLAGTYALEGASTCTTCPPGYKCLSTTTNATNYPCINGTYSVGGETTCTTCPAGYICPYTYQAVQIACVAGTYSTAGATECTTCPAGYSCDTKGYAITACDAGSYSLEGDAACTACPAGSFCPSTTAAIIYECQQAFYSIEGSDSCSYCLAGFACPTTACVEGSCEQLCPSGTFSEGGQTTCTECPAG